MSYYVYNWYGQRWIQHEIPPPVHMETQNVQGSGDSLGGYISASAGVAAFGDTYQRNFYFDPAHDRMISQIVIDCDGDADIYAEVRTGGPYGYTSHGTLIEQQAFPGSRNMLTFTFTPRLASDTHVYIKNTTGRLAINIYSIQAGGSVPLADGVF